MISCRECHEYMLCNNGELQRGSPISRLLRFAHEDEGWVVWPHNHRRSTSKMADLNGDEGARIIAMPFFQLLRKIASHLKIYNSTIQVQNFRIIITTDTSHTNNNMNIIRKESCFYIFMSWIHKKAQ